MKSVRLNRFGWPVVAVVAVFWMIFVAEIPAQEEDAAAVPEVIETKSLGDVYTQGGWIMHVLLVCSIGTIAIVVYCFVQITPKKMVPKNLVESINRTMQKRDIQNAYALCEENPNSFSRVISAALLKANFDRDLANKGSMEQAAVETIEQEETKQMLWVNYLNVFATLAPMIGLLGTVWGMIESFDQLARGASEPQDLAGGIGKAMSTTAGGLIVGIPAMFFYFFLSKPTHDHYFADPEAGHLCGGCVVGGTQTRGW